MAIFVAKTYQEAASVIMEGQDIGVGYISQTIGQLIDTVDITYLKDQYYY